MEQINNNNLKDNHFLQIVSPSLSIAEYLQAFDIFILTSGAEGVPTAILEAMASSLPIISSRVGGVSEIVVPKKNGFLFDPQDIQMAVKHILLLGADINMQEKFGVQNRIDAKLKYDTLVCTETHIKAFSLALSNKTT